MAEALMNTLSHGRFTAYSAGSQPKGSVVPEVLALLANLPYPVEVLRSKSWEEFSTPEAPTMDFVFTVCDEVAQLTCPVWPGKPMIGHWGVADPVAFEGTPAQKAANYANVLRQIRTRIELFLALPIHALDQLAIKSQIDEIGKTKN
jgi:arsenate reductase